MADRCEAWHEEHKGDPYYQFIGLMHEVTEGIIKAGAERGQPDRMGNIAESSVER